MVDLEKLNRIETPSNSDQFFLVSMGVLVLLTQAGFSLIEAGTVRSKNVLNIFVKNTIDLFVAAIAFFLTGYALAWGDIGNFFVGENYFLLIDMSTSYYAHFFFNLCLASLCAIIVSGAISERTQFGAYPLFSFFVAGVIYPVVAHWGWNPEGWIYICEDDEGDKLKYQDFGGSSLIHVVGGTAGLIGSLVLGPRMGRFEQGKPVTFKAYSTPLIGVGGMLLLIGFVASNGGLQGHVSLDDDGTTIITAIVNTVLSGATSALITILLRRTWGKCYGHHWNLLSVINGFLAGMVASCAGCDVMMPYAGLPVGFIAGTSYVAWDIVLIHFGVDDPLSSVPVHLGGGMWGILAAPLFNKNSGVLYVGDKYSFKLLGWNLLGCLVIIVWTAVASFIVLFILKKIKFFRVSKKVEQKGLDRSTHGESIATRRRRYETTTPPFMPRAQAYRRRAAPSGGVSQMVDPGLIAGPDIYNSRL